MTIAIVASMNKSNNTKKLDAFEKKYIISVLIDEAERLKGDNEYGLDELQVKNNLDMIDAITEKLYRDVETLKL